MMSKGLPRKPQEDVNNTEELAEKEEKEKMQKIMGQLRAAEARSRLRMRRLKFEASQAREIEQLIACQPSALEALRLERVLRPNKIQKDSTKNLLSRAEVDRVNYLMEDSNMLQLKRTR